MPTSSTLALGQASYELLEALGTPDSEALDSQRVVETLRAEQRGGLIDGLSIGVREGYAFGGGEGLGDILSLNIADASRGLLFNDSDAADPSFVEAFNQSNTVEAPLSNATSDANINILAHADQAEFALGGGDNRLNAARDLTNSEVQALDGSDTIRIGGRADGSFVSLGDGNDQLTVGRSSHGLDVDTGAGDDSALFLGTLTASETAARTFQTEDGNEVTVNEGSNLINLGDGNDKARFLGGIQGGIPGSTGYEVQLGAGNDSVEFGRGSVNDGFVLNTGIGSDDVSLGRETTSAVIDLGWDGEGTPPSGDSVVLGAGALLQQSGIRSGQSQDTLKLAGEVIDTSLDLGWGDSLVEVSGTVLMGSSENLGVWDLGGGSDTLVFSGTSDVSDGGSGGYINLGLGADSLTLLGGGFGIEFDLGNDDSIDEISFGTDIAYGSLVISNFGTNDILWIGNGKYGYEYELLNAAANLDDLTYFMSGANVIWSQEENGGNSTQEVMTLGTDQFVGVSLTASETEAIAELDDASDWVSGWSPISEMEPTPEPYFPDYPA